MTWFVLLSKESLCKSMTVLLIGHTLKLSVDDVELSIWEDEDVAFHINWTQCFDIIIWYYNYELNSFLHIHQSQSWTIKINVTHTPAIDEKTESISCIKVCCIHCTVFFIKSSENFLSHISSPHSLTVNLIRDSIHNHLHLSYVRIERLLTISCSCCVWLLKEKSLHRPPWGISCFTDYCVSPFI